MGDLASGLRLAVTTLTVLRLPTGRVDRATARIAMLCAPLVGLAMGALAALVAYAARQLWHSSAIAALAALITLAATSGLLHLDGLADTADGLGAPAGRDRLAIMKTPGIGAFGAAALVFVLLTQLLALTLAFDGRLGTIAVVTAATTARLGVTIGCVRGVPAARLDGLGATVVGSVQRLAAVLTVAVTTVILGALALVHDDAWTHVGRVAWSVAAGIAGTLFLYTVAVRRVGGVTGDVLGAAVELCTAVVLLAMCIRA
jgi:adenosylcobinamide-GDP ribazoletransferase